MPIGQSQRTEVEQVAEIVLRSFVANATAVLVIAPGGALAMRTGVAIRPEPGRRASRTMRELADALRTMAAGLEADALELEPMED